jgi:hypothetical protein
MIMETPWFEFIVIGLTFWFIVPTFFCCCILFYCAAEDNPGLALVVTGIYLLIIQICSNFNILTWLSENPWTFVKYLILYIIIGVIFACSKFWLYLIEKRRIFDMKFVEFLKSKSIYGKGYTFKTLPDEFKSACYIAMRGYSLPDLYQSTRYITFWMGYWPIVGLWTLINNPLRWLWEEIKHQLSQLFETTHKKILGDRADTLNEWHTAHIDKNKKSLEKDHDIKESDWQQS